MDASRSDCLLPTIGLPTVPLSAAGRPLATSHEVIRSALERHGGEVLSRQFCAPHGQGQCHWKAEEVAEGQLRPVLEFDATGKQEARAALVALLATIEALRSGLVDEGRNAQRYLIQALGNLVKVPAPECVFFDGRELRIICWGEALWTSDGPGKHDLYDVLQQLNPPPPPLPPSPPLPRPIRTRLANVFRKPWLDVRSSQAEAATRRENAGGSTGTITITLLWNSPDDLDLSVVCAGGERICYADMATGGGVLDVDMNCSYVKENPVENIFFETLPAAGTYRVQVKNFKARLDGDPGSNFEVVLAFPDGVATIEDRLREMDGLRQVAEFTILSDNRIETNLRLTHRQTQDV